MKPKLDGPVNVESGIAGIITDIEKDWTIKLPWVKAGTKFVFYLNDTNELEMHIKKPKN